MHVNISSYSSRLLTYEVSHSKISPCACAHVLNYERFWLDFQYAKSTRVTSLSFSRINMEDEQYAALTNYLKNGVYPDGFSKGQKYSLRRSAKSYKLETGKLYYVDTQQDGTLLNRIVLKKNEAERVF